MTVKKQLYFPLLTTLLALLIFSVLPFGQPAMVYAATIANDTFTDANGTNLEDHTADDGSTWTVDELAKAQIDGNQLEGKTFNEGRNSDDMGQDAVSAQADCRVTVAGSDMAAGVMVRMHNTNTPGNDGFQGKIEGSTTSARLVITKMVGGSETLLASTAADSYALSQWYTLKLTAVNEGSATRLRLYEGGTEKLSFLETNHPMQGTNYRRAGVVVWDAKSYVDNWQSDTLPDISNTPDTWDFGVVDASSSYETGITYSPGSSGFQITNNSTFDVNITISATDMGSGWLLADSGDPDATHYTLWAGTELTGGLYNIQVTSGGVPLITVLASSTRDWGLKLMTPTSFSEGGQKSGTVTLTATAA